MAIINENTFDHLVGSEGVRLDGWYLGKPTYQESIREYTHEQVGVRLDYCSYCGTKLMKAEETLEAESDNNTL